MPAARLYVIRGLGLAPRLVRSTHLATALKHVAESTYQVNVASQDELVELVASGVKVEDIKAEEASHAPV